jgi:hypothetical protein
MNGKKRKSMPKSMNNPMLRSMKKKKRKEKKRKEKKKRARTCK